MRERIFKAIGGIPAESLYNYIKQGIVTYQELLEHGLDKFPEKKAYVESKLSAGEQSAWNDAAQMNTVEGYDKYLSSFPKGAHASEAHESLTSLEDSYWQQIEQNISDHSLTNYKRIFPNGKYIAQCDALLSDMPWFETKKRNTIEAYRTYAANYPSKHIDEIKQAIIAIEDENDWNHATQINTTSAYKQYLEKHPHGSHANTAKERIANRSQKEIVLDAIRKNKNSYKANDLKNKVENGVITWDDLQEIFSDEQVQAIQEWTESQELQRCTPPEELRKDSTEIYFWGTKGTGKTCAMGAVLSTAKKNAKMVARNCHHRAYLDQLSNLFGSTRTICNLPESTSKDSIAEMNLQLIDSKYKRHNVTFIDLAGEVVTGIYKYQNNMPLLDSEQATIKRVLSYLQNPHNNKIHFFILEYGSAGKPVVELEEECSGICQSDVLTSIAEFLDIKGGLHKSTVGVYGLVTKSDKIDSDYNSSPDQRPELAHEYVEKDLAAFWEAIKIACKKAKVKDLKTISFSIGNVFAQNLCVSDGADSMKIVGRLLQKTPSEPEGCLKWLFK